MINGLIGALKSNNDTVYHNSLAINSLSYAISFLLTLDEMDHRLHQLQNGLRKL